MKLLLDTHLVLWWLSDAPELTEAARAEIALPDNAAFVSAVTLWEISLKVSLGKLRIPAQFYEKLEEEDFDELPVTWAHSRQFGRLPWHHRDPFDRMLIAQAQSEDLTLLTADRILQKYGDAVRWVGSP